MKRIIWATLFTIVTTFALVYCVLRFGDPEQIPFLKSIAILLPLIGALWGLHYDNQKNDFWHKKAAPSLYFGAAVVGCLILWDDQRTVREAKAAGIAWQEIAERRQGEEMTAINRIGGMKGDAAMAQKYIEGIQKYTRQFTSEKTPNAVGKLFSSMAERQKNRVEVQQTNEKVRIAALVRAQPVCNLIYAKFDAWLEEVQKRGLKITSTKNDAPCISYEARHWTMSRAVSFENDRSATVQMINGSVEDGHVMGDVQVVVYFSSPGKSSDMMLNIIISDSNYDVMNAKPARFSFKAFEGQLPNPIEDMALSSAINDALDEVMAFMVEDVALSKTAQ